MNFFNKFLTIGESYKKGKSVYLVNGKNTIESFIEGSLCANFQFLTLNTFFIFKYY